MTFKTPHTIGDVLLLVFLLPIGCAALAFLFMLPLTLAIVATGAEVSERTVYALAIFLWRWGAVSGGGAVSGWRRPSWGLIRGPPLPSGPH